MPDLGKEDKAVRAGQRGGGPSKVHSGSGCLLAVTRGTHVEGVHTPKMAGTPAQGFRESILPRAGNLCLYSEPTGVGIWNLGIRPH